VLVFITRNIKTIIIFSFITISALQCFLFISFYGVDIPVGDDWEYVNFAKVVSEKGEFWKEEVFWKWHEQRPIMPSLILMVNVTLFSWNAFFQLYLGWFLILVSVVTLYYITKKIDERLTWMLMPISLLFFNPYQYEVLLWGFPSNSWFLTFTAIILSIYFLNKDQRNSSFILSIVFGIIATLSTMIGLLVWPIGLTKIELFKKAPIKFISWTSILVASFVLYFFDFEITTASIEPSSFLMIGYVEFFSKFISSGLFPGHPIMDIFHISSGILITSFLIFIFICYFSKKIKNDKIFPFIQLGLIGIISAVIIEFGRYGLASPLSSRYIPIAIIAQLSFIILFSFIILEYYQSNHKIKKMVWFIWLGILILVFSSGVLATYYIGWTSIGEMWKNTRSMELNCITSSLSLDKCEGDFYIKERLENNVMILKEKRLGPFKP